MPRPERQLPSRPQKGTAQRTLLDKSPVESRFDALEAALAEVQNRRSRQAPGTYSAEPMAKSIRPTLRGALIGRVLGDARERVGLTQRAAAAKLGISQSSLADIETGRRALTVEDAIRFAELYGIAFTDLDIRHLDPKQALVKRSRGRPRTGGDFGAISEVAPSDLRQEAERRLREAEDVFTVGRADRSNGLIREALAMFVADAGWRVNKMPRPDDTFIEGMRRLEEYRSIADIGEIVTLTDLALSGYETSLRELRQALRLVRTIGRLLETPAAEGDPTG